MKATEGASNAESAASTPGGAVAVDHSVTSAGLAGRGVTWQYLASWLNKRARRRAAISLVLAFLAWMLIYCAVAMLSPSGCYGTGTGPFPFARAQFRFTHGRVVLEPKWGDKDEYGHYWRGSDGTWIWKYLDTYRVYPSPRGLVVVEDVDGGEVWFMPRRPLGGALKFEGLPQRLLPKCIKDWLGVRG